MIWTAWRMMTSLAPSGSLFGLETLAEISLNDKHACSRGEGAC